MKKTVLIIIILTLAATSSGAAPAVPAWGPWSSSADSPAMRMTADRESSGSNRSAREDAGLASTPFLWLITLYQRVISPVDGDRCLMYPTCSQYGKEAIRKHGPVLGIIMTTDRLIHESDEQALSLPVKVGDRYRYLDPVENNDFWWRTP